MVEYANKINVFYNRFDCHDFSREAADLQNILSTSETNSHSFLTVSVDEVREEFSKLNSSKAAGPDRLLPCVVKNCANELAYIFASIFNLSFRTQTVPTVWKQSCIIPVPKKPTITCFNDLRPVALTSVAMKICERFALKFLKPMVNNYLDPLQFAYRSKRSTEDAILYTLENLYSHLEYTKLGYSSRIMFFDFSSAFNTIQPHILARKLLEMNVRHDFILWICNYLTNRSQYVKICSSNNVSHSITSNTGAPQGTVLAPFLFTLYTSDARSTNSNCTLVKFADDTALLGLIKNDDDTAYLDQINHFTNYCDQNFLELNVNKTKEMVIDFRKSHVVSNEVIIKGGVVERVDNYKYLGVLLDSRLSWHDHIDMLMKKLNSRMYCLRAMNRFNVQSKILAMFYKSVICGVWQYNLVSWGGNVRKEDEQRIDAMIMQAGRVIGISQPSMGTSYKELLGNKLDNILRNDEHPLHTYLDRAVIPRSGRMRLPLANTNRHPSSFIPQCIKLHNLNFKRS